MALGINFSQYYRCGHVAAAIVPPLLSCLRFSLSVHQSPEVLGARLWDRPSGYPLVALLTGSGLMGRLPETELGRPLREGH